MNIVTLSRFIINHPLNRKNKTKSLIRFFKWQINTIINPYPIVYTFTEKSKLIIKKGMTGATQNLYCGLHDFNEMFFLLHFLRKEDLFIDIGANIGSYTVLAASHIEADTISIEPVPSTFKHLINNISINQIHNKVKALNIALGSKKGSIAFTSTMDTMNHVATDSDKNIINVNVDTLDNLLLDNKKPALIKIDVEGFETEVLNGAISTINENNLKAIIIELNGSGDRYGYSEMKIHETLTSVGFNPYFYDPITRQIKLTDCFGKNNTIYIRDIDFVKKRLEKAEKVKILTDNI